MYSDLPEQLQKEVRGKLLAGNFRAAKELHDSWMAQQHCSSSSHLQTRIYTKSNRNRPANY